MIADIAKIKRLLNRELKTRADARGGSVIPAQAELPRGNEMRLKNSRNPHAP